MARPGALVLSPRVDACPGEGPAKRRERTVVAPENAFVSAGRSVKDVTTATPEPPGTSVMRSGRERTRLGIDSWRRHGAVIAPFLKLDFALGGLRNARPWPLRTGAGTFAITALRIAHNEQSQVVSSAIADSTRNRAMAGDSQDSRATAH
jgi:hypothetical protein